MTVCFCVLLFSGVLLIEVCNKCNFDKLVKNNLGYDHCRSKTFRAYNLKIFKSTIDDPSKLLILFAVMNTNFKIKECVKKQMKVLPKNKIFIHHLITWSSIVTINSIKNSIHTYIHT